MNFAGHVSLACATWMGFVTVAHDGIEAALSFPSLSVLPVVIFGSLLPDIDHPDSTFGRRIRPVSTILSLFTHRGITHSLWAVAGMIYLLSIFDLSQLWIHALIIGYLSHLVGDAITPAGIKPFWPLPFRMHINPVISILLGLLTTAFIFHGV
jgi:inner membrane protein